MNFVEDIMKTAKKIRQKCARQASRKKSQKKEAESLPTNSDVNVPSSFSAGGDSLPREENVTLANLQGFWKNDLDQTIRVVDNVVFLRDSATPLIEKDDFFQIYSYVLPKHSKQIQWISTKTNKTIEWERIGTDFLPIEIQDSLEWESIDFDKNASQYTVIHGKKGHEYWFKFSEANKLGSGSYGSVYYGWDMANRTKVAVKLCDRTKDAAREKRFYKALKGKKGFPEYHYASMIKLPAKDKEGVLHPSKKVHYGVVVMELLGENLKEFGTTYHRELSKEAKSKPGPVTVLHILKQLVECFRACGEAGIAHGDIKTANFCFGRGEKAHKIYVVDFGLAKFMNDSTHRKGYIEGWNRSTANKKRKPSGTVSYSSYNMHGRLNQKNEFKLHKATFADDLESLIYVAFSLTHHRRFPWDGLMRNTKLKPEQQFQLMQEMKNCFFQPEGSRAAFQALVNSKQHGKLMQSIRKTKLTWNPSITDRFQPFLALTRELYHTKMIRTMENEDEFLHLDDIDYDQLIELLERNLNRSGFSGQSDLMRKAFPLMEFVHSPEIMTETPQDMVVIIDGSCSVRNEENPNYVEEVKLKPRAWTTDDTQSVTDSGLDLSEMRMRKTSDISLNLTDDSFSRRTRLRSTRRTTTNGSFSDRSLYMNGIQPMNH